MSRLAPLFVAAVIATGADSAAAEVRPRVVFWQPYDVAGAAAPARARQALERNLGARGLQMVDGSDEPPATPSLAPALTAALDDYRAFRFAEALSRLDALEVAARAAGGGDLDARQLADLYLYRALSYGELGRGELAWDDFVRAARLEPARLLDPARFAPRALAAYGRAAAEALAVAPATVTLTPADALLRVDGRDVTSPLALAPGSHFVRAVAAGFVPWAAVVEVTAARQALALPPTPLQPLPLSGARLTALAGSGRALTAVVTRDGGGWRLRVHDLAGATVDVAIDADSAERAVDAALQQLLDPPAVARKAVAPRKPIPWWAWTIAAGAAAAAIVVPIAVVYGQPSGASVGGTIGALR